jgi:nucleoside-diphosphate-sugar epimerase
MAKKIAAISGARGLIGKYIVEQLISSGWHVRILTRELNIRIKCKPNIEVVAGDINDPAVIKSFLSSAEAVFHCAAELHDENNMNHVNVSGTKCILDAISVESRVKYFCYLSSAGVVGPASIKCVDENTECAPSNVYERTKYEAELMVLEKKLAMNVCVLRPANVFDGTSEWLIGLGKRLSIKHILALILKGKEGAHLVHAADVAAAAVYFIDKHLAKPEVFFVSYDDDARNTVLSVYKLCRSFKAGNKFEWFSLIALPNQFSYMIRTMLKGNSLHGRVRFSEDKLKRSGFDFPLGLDAGLKKACLVEKLANK